MGEPAIRIEELGKRYRIGELRSGRGLLFRGLRRGTGGGQPESIWALRELTLDVAAGEVTGVIGGNGAGKSTLLKILSRITAPTTGHAVIRGRVGSLLEVGTGFHPELTGRENVFLNGAILGMRRAEIQRRFDEIIAFAEVETFVDTPVKRYSNGMHMRLAFSVAAHLDTEILLIDEVLAVGDVAFQEKCIDKVHAAIGQGRTVVFVSHNMGVINSLCQRVAVLERGRLSFAGAADQAVAHYLETQVSVAADRAELEQQLAALPNDPDLQLVDLRLAQEGSVGLRLRADQPIAVELDYELRQPVSGLRLGFDVRTADTALPVFRSWLDDAGLETVPSQPGRYRSRAVLPASLLASGGYQLEPIVILVNRRNVLWGDLLLRFDVDMPGELGDRYGQRRPGVVRPAVVWSTAPEAGD